jgi:hypothetical protein
MELRLPREKGDARVDILGVTPDGRLVIVECKLWRNPEARREVIAQVLEYVALIREQARTQADLEALLRRQAGWVSDRKMFDTVKAAAPTTLEAAFGDGDMMRRIPRTGEARCMTTGLQHGRTPSTPFAAQASAMSPLARTRVCLKELRS